MTEDKKIKIEFAPGAFDNFDGTQEELDELLAEIQKMADSGEMLENSRELSEDDWDELPDEIKEQIISSFDEVGNPKPRTLQ
jgi:hypothetical protein